MGYRGANLNSQLKPLADPTPDNDSRPAETTSAWTAIRTQTDAELVRRAGAGERAAFEELHQRHYPQVYRFALAMIGNADDAQDVVQNAFVKTWLSLGRVRDGQAFLKFLYRVVVNLTRDGAKAGRRSPVRRFLDTVAFGNSGTRAPAEEIASTEPDPEATSITHERDRVLRREVAQLPTEFREVLVLYHLEGVDVKQVAELLGIPEGTVKSRLGRARERLRSRMGEWVETEVAR